MARTPLQAAQAACNDGYAYGYDLAVDGGGAADAVRPWDVAGSGGAHYDHREEWEDGLAEGIYDGIIESTKG